MAFGRRCTELAKGILSYSSLQISITLLIVIADRDGKIDLSNRSVVVSKFVDVRWNSSARRLRMDTLLTFRLNDSGKIQAKLPEFTFELPAIFELGRPFVLVRLATLIDRVICLTKLSGWLICY